MENLVKTIAKAICDFPEEVEVKEIEATTSSILEVKIKKEDLGKMIGKHGRTAAAIRTIIYAVSHKHKTKTGRPKRFQLEILDK
jgi:predicted RNA-binding protein YlqC (UPF0109 family)